MCHVCVSFAWGWPNLINVWLKVRAPTRGILDRNKKNILISDPSNHIIRRKQQHSHYLVHGTVICLHEYIYKSCQPRTPLTLCYICVTSYHTPSPSLTWHLRAVTNSNGRIDSVVQWKFSCHWRTNRAADSTLPPILERKYKYIF